MKKAWWIVIALAIIVILLLIFVFSNKYHIINISPLNKSFNNPDTNNVVENNPGTNSKDYCKNLYEQIAQELKLKSNVECSSDSDCVLDKIQVELCSLNNCGAGVIYNNKLDKSKFESLVTKYGQTCSKNIYDPCAAMGTCAQISNPVARCINKICTVIRGSSCISDSDCTDGKVCWDGSGCGMIHGCYTKEDKDFYSRNNCGPGA